MEKKEIKFQNLVAEMARNGETQASISQLLGISKATISLKLKGQRDWTLGEVEQLCEHFGKEPYQLFIKRK